MAMYASQNQTSLLDSQFGTFDRWDIQRVFSLLCVSVLSLLVLSSARGP